MSLHHEVFPWASWAKGAVLWGAVWWGAGPVPTARAAQDPALPTAESLAATLTQMHKHWEVPGMAVAVVHRGEVVMARGFGVKQVRGDEPVDGDTLFAIASNSKAFTAATLAILEEDGVLDWKDRVVDHVPGFQLYDPWVTHEMRLDDLLCHRSGLRTFGGDLLWYRTTYDAPEIIRRLRYLKPVGRFRAHYGYQNLMFLTAGQVVAEASGRPWAQFVTQRIFEPLGMTRTRAVPSAVQGMDNVATPHVIPGGKTATRVPWFREDVLAPVGGIASSARDLSRWLLLQLGRGEVDGVRLFSEESSRRMWEVHNPLAVGDATRELSPTTHFLGYGLGWGLADYRGRKMVRHGGAIDGMFSYTAMIPEEELGVVVLTNADATLQSAVAYTVLDAYLGADDTDWNQVYLQRWRDGRQEDRDEAKERADRRIPGTSPSRPLEAYTGTFGGDLYGDATITLEGGALVLRLLPAPELVATLEHWHLDTYALYWKTAQPWFGKGWCQFVLDQDGKVVEFHLDVPNDDFWFDELEFKRKD